MKRLIICFILCGLTLCMFGCFGQTGLPEESTDYIDTTPPIDESTKTPETSHHLTDSTQTEPGSTTTEPKYSLKYEFWGTGDIKISPWTEEPYSGFYKELWKYTDAPDIHIDNLDIDSIQSKIEEETFRYYKEFYGDQYPEEAYSVRRFIYNTAILPDGSACVVCTIQIDICPPNNIMTITDWFFVT